ncbi:GGDEF domain-containing protein [Flagellatimonas centrodinii]|uniref:GGDEF domain-containing protein n=1 Tax=Flagellatimonas centrodinii TaxID=2806210 RepID=UPI0023BB0B1E|nr:sensor domain-containing diguanylate cyclase [Flagellatimonas centrodinii]
MDALLNQLAQSVSGAEDLETLTRPLLELLETVTGMESTYLTSIEPTRTLQHILYARNTGDMTIPEGLSVPWEDTLCRRSLEEDIPFVNDVATRWGDSEAARALGIKTYLSQPVRAPDGALFGTLCAASGARHEIPPQTLRIFGLFAQLIAQQIEREQLVDRLRSSNAELSAHALVDALTGIANRRALLVELGRTLARRQRDGNDLLLAFLDLNGFKTVNDVHGHDAGDALLCQVARELSQGMRTGDVVGRYGGDEFVVIANGRDPAELAVRLQRLVSRELHWEGETITFGGASAGVVRADADDTVASLMARADAAMYEVKNARKAARG